MKNTMETALKLLNQAVLANEGNTFSYSEKTMNKVIEARKILKNIGLKYDDINYLVISVVDNAK